MTTPAFTEHMCSKCTSIVSTEDIDISKKVLSKVGYEPIFVGVFTKLGWPGHVPFYIFKCGGCHLTVIDSPHGYTRDGGTLFLEHRSCLVPTVTVDGVGITRLSLEARNIKELEESIAPQEIKTIDTAKVLFWVVLAATVLFFLANTFWHSN